MPKPCRLLPPRDSSFEADGAERARKRERCGERPGLATWVASAVILTGVLLITRSKRAPAATRAAG